MTVHPALPVTMIDGHHPTAPHKLSRWPEPEYDDAWPELHRLRWLAGLIYAELGLTITVETTDDNQYIIRFADADRSMSPGTFDQAHRSLTGAFSAAYAMNARLAETVNLHVRRHAPIRKLEHDLNADEVRVLTGDWPYPFEPTSQLFCSTKDWVYLGWAPNPGARRAARFFYHYRHGMLMRYGWWAVVKFSYRNALR